MRTFICACAALHLFLVSTQTSHVDAADPEKTQSSGSSDSAPKKKKSLSDYNDVDMERIYDEWEVSWWTMTVFFSLR